MAKSKKWSMKDIKTIQRVIKHGLATGKSEKECLQSAADYFGITLNAITLRWKRWKKGEHMETLTRGTTKIPLVRKKRNYTKRKIAEIQTKAVEEVTDFQQKQAMTRELRKMVIDLMNTSGQIKAVSVDLSNKSFTVIY